MTYIANYEINLRSLITLMTLKSVQVTYSIILEWYSNSTTVYFNDRTDHFHTKSIIVYLPNICQLFGVTNGDQGSDLPIITAWGKIDIISTNLWVSTNLLSTLGLKVMRNRQQMPRSQ